MWPVGLEEAVGQLANQRWCRSRRRESGGGAGTTGAGRWRTPGMVVRAAGASANDGLARERSRRRRHGRRWVGWRFRRGQAAIGGGGEGRVMGKSD